MKQFFLFVAIVSITNHVLCMDTFLKKFTGEHITGYIDMPTEQQESPPITIINQTSQDLIFKATYACKVRILYATMRYLSCSSIRTFEGTTDCNDMPVRCNHTQTIKLAPAQKTLAASKVRLAGLKVCLVSNPQTWISVTLPPSTDHHHPNCIYTLTHQGDNLLLQKNEP